jgi:hypothetical protein
MSPLEQHNNPSLKAARTLLFLRGQVEKGIGELLWCVYNDEKITIRGQLFGNSISGVLIELNMSSDTPYEEPFHAFGPLWSQTPAKTAVLFSPDSEVVTFYREGHWTKHVSMVSRFAEKYHERMMELAKFPADDGRLFQNLR